jgi:7,8-dihydropterin-6-yl-methyl-4-(beta-D-ribofuranosyl)aminobenzene 5'-phosphate synthase
MKLTVLADNNTYIDRYYLGEPAFSCWIETGGCRILFDVGYSDVFLRNADAMGIPVREADVVALSHGHNDHTGGLAVLCGENLPKRPELVAHPAAFDRRYDEGLMVGCPVPRETLARTFRIHESCQPLWLTDDLAFLGEIPETAEQRTPVGTLAGGAADGCMDDTALAYRGSAGVYIITGCSHSGICNIVNYAKEVTGQTRIAGILGGMHLLQYDDHARRTLAFLEREEISELWPCHCTGFAVRAQMSRTMPIREVGVGLTLDWE